MGARRPKPVDAKSYRHKQFFLTSIFKKMKTTKMSLASMQGKLSRAEMKNIMAGSGGANCSDSCTSDSDCNGSDNSCHHCATGSILTGKCVTSE
jgi:hypothetical protein